MMPNIVAMNTEKITDDEFKVSDGAGHGHHSEARHKVTFPAALAGTPIVTATLTEMDIAPWGCFVYCSKITPTDFELVVRVGLNEHDVKPDPAGTPPPRKRVLVNWIAVL